jgi:hypothetical protein
LNAVLANWLSSNPFLAPVAVIQSSGIKGTVADGSADVLRGSQLNNNYFQNRDNAEILRNTTTDDVVDVS